MAGGEYTEGRLFVIQDTMPTSKNEYAAALQPKYYNINGRPLIIDGRQLHGSEPFQGNRCSVVAFTHKSFWHHVPSSARAKLKELGFLMVSIISSFGFMLV